MSDNIISLRGERGLDLSVIIPVGNRHGEPLAVYSAYRSALGPCATSLEFIYVVEPGQLAYLTQLKALQARGEPVVIVELAHRFGEAVDINVGVERARSERVLIVPAYLQVEPAALPALIGQLRDADLVAAVRDRRGDHFASRVRAWSLQQLSRIAGSSRVDLGCLVIASRRTVLRELHPQDEHHRFLPLLAANAGFSVRYVVLPQAVADRGFRWHRPTTYIGRAVDLMAVAFLLRFMQRPFRFFGSVGSVMAVAGLLLAAVLSFQRLALNVPLAERPALLLAVLLIVLGVQIAAVGLIAEIIIFMRARRLPSYRIDEVVEQSLPAATAESMPDGTASPAMQARSADQGLIA